MLNHCGSSDSSDKPLENRLRITARGSKVLYTRCPKPMIRSRRSQPGADLLVHRSSPPIACSSFMTCSLAPPCSGPLSAPIAPSDGGVMSDNVEAITRAVKVDAFISWSACRIRAASNVFAAAGLGCSPASMCRKLAACERPGSGATGSSPRRRRSYRATIVGIFAIRRVALAQVGVHRVRNSCRDRRTGPTTPRSHSISIGSA